MTASIAQAPVFQGIGPNGILPGGQLFTYAAGTSTPQATYTDSTETQANTNPVILNAFGQASVWLVAGQTYKLVLQDSQGNQIWSQDQILGGGVEVGQNAVLLTVTAPALQVPALSDGTVTSFATAVGQAQVFDGQTNVTTSAVFSIIGQQNCTASMTGSTYSFTALSQNIGSITIQATYLGNNYIAQVTCSKQLAGAVGSPGAAGPPGPGGVAGLSMVLSNPSSSVLAYANGNVPSFAGISGIAHVLSGGVDVSESSTYSVVLNNCAGTVNTADSVPIVGQQIGYYQMTAMSAPIASMVISAIFSGSTVSQTYTVTQVPTGYQIVTSLPSSGPALFQGNVVFLTTDNQLYRYTGSAWTPAVPAVNITGTITTTQISPGSITTPLLAANSVTAANIAANAITAGAISAGSVTTNAISAGAVTAAKIGVTQLSAISANVGTITSGLLQSPSGSNYLDLNNSYLVFNNGVNMVVRGDGFGATSNYLEWFGPTQSSAGNFAACTDALGLAWQKTDGSQFYAGSLGPQFVGQNGFQSFPGGLIMQWGQVHLTSNPQNVTYPTPFLTQVFSIQLTQEGSNFALIVNSTTLTLFQIGTGAVADCYWLAIGK